MRKRHVALRTDELDLRGGVGLDLLILVEALVLAAMRLKERKQ
jgi:hypothetical protein